MATIQDCPVDLLIQRLDHLPECYDNFGCNDPVHRWNIDSWKIVFDRLVSWSSDVSSLSDTIRRGLPRRLFDAVEGLVRQSWHHAECIRQDNAKIRSDLEQIRNGAAMRTREEIIAAIEAATIITTTPRVQARTQYAAMRVAQALTWALEAPLGCTKTGFHPDRADGIA